MCFPTFPAWKRIVLCIFIHCIGVELAFDCDFVVMRVGIVGLVVMKHIYGIKALGIKTKIRKENKVNLCISTHTYGMDAN